MVKKSADGKWEYAPGPWDMEPDRKEWKHAGFPCLIVRARMGALCGYIAVPPGHPWHGKDYNNVPAEAHGGLTYSAECHGDICHKPGAGEPDNVWWLGFDCAHAGDLVPERRPVGGGSYPRFPVMSYETYKDISYVMSEVEQLAEQAEAISPNRESP